MIRSYLRHALQAGNAHSIHSPFVYELYTQVIRPGQTHREAEEPVFERIEARRRELLRQSSEIEVLDLGAGSRSGNSNRRRIKDIARNAEKPARFGRLLYRLCRYVQPASVIELGTSFGVTTAYLATGAPRSGVTTLEGCPATAEVARRTFEKLELENAEVVLGNIDATLPATFAENYHSPALVFFDANHRYEPTVRYFEEALAHARPEDVFVFDDIYWSDEMKAAWAYIKSHPSVTVSVDLFWLGLVFFRTGQVREHFKLKM